VNFDWQVPVIVAVLVGAILYFMRKPTGEPRREDAEADMDTTQPEPEPLTGPDLVDQIQRTLGIGILVDTISSDEPVTIRATFMYGQYTTPVAVTADTEAKAWEELAKAAIAWRKSDYQNIPMWWGGGG
jgi:hypothetical protein